MIQIHLFTALTGVLRVFLHDSRTIVNNTAGINHKKASNMPSRRGRSGQPYRKLQNGPQYKFILLKLILILNKNDLRSHGKKHAVGSYGTNIYVAIWVMIFTQK
jgi:hypothetical protein